MTKSPTRITRSQLLRTLTNDPALPALIERMDTPTLTRLIERVGVEDSGALIELTRPEQLAALFDETLWQRDGDEVEESLSVEELLRWFDVFHDVSNDFAAARLYELGEEFCATSFAQLLYVRSELLTGPPLDDFSAVFGEYFVRARYEDEWDTILRALTGLWSEHPDFLLQILGRLSFRHSILANDDAPRRLQADAASERTARRERRGYIGASDAAAWLELARHAPLDDLVGARAYDALTERSLRALEAEAPAAGKPADDEPAMETDVTDADLDALQAALDAADIGPDTRAPRLTGPEPRGADAALRLALAALQQRSPQAFAARMRELAYLSNALVTAVRRNGARFDHESAANAAMATCNLGSEYLAIGSPTDGFDHVLTTEPGLVRAFSVGFSLIQRLPIAVAEGVAALFARNDVRDRLAPKRWVLDEVDSLLANGALADSVRARKLDDAKETISLLVIALKPEACVGLRVLVDELPALPRVLEQSERTAAVGESSRFIASVGDLARIERFLSGLADAVRL